MTSYTLKKNRTVENGIWRISPTNPRKCMQNYKCVGISLRFGHVSLLRSTCWMRLYFRMCPSGHHVRSTVQLMRMTHHDWQLRLKSVYFAMFSFHSCILNNLLNDFLEISNILKLFFSFHISEKRSFIIQITKTEKHKEHWTKRLKPNQD
jgi:hypothetical protein